MEQRIFSFDLDGEENVETKTMKITGIVNSGNWSKELGVTRKFYERIEVGTWEKAITRSQEQNRPIHLLLNHRGHSMMASTKNGSLKLYEVNGELRMEAELCDTTLNRDVYSMIISKLVDSFSFGFSVREDGDKWERRDGKRYRIVTDIDLYEVSCLSDSPAYEQTAIYARSMEESEKNIPEEPQERNVEVEVPQQKEINVEELVIKTVNETIEKMKVHYDEIISNLKQTIEVEKPTQVEVINEPVIEEQPVVEEVKSVEPEQPKVDISKHIEMIEKIKSLKEVNEK